MRGSALIEVSGLKKRAINETDIGFAIGPRLNAIGRLEDANPAVTLMSTFDPEEAQLLANQLDTINLQKKAICGNDFERSSEYAFRFKSSPFNCGR